MKSKRQLDIKNKTTLSIFQEFHFTERALKNQLSFFKAQQSMSESSQKLDLIRQALEIHRQQLPAESSIAGK